MSFGERLRQLRISTNLTQEQLAKKIKLSKANISKYEADLVEPNIDTLKILSKIFNVSTDYLLEKTNIKESELPKKLNNSQTTYNREEFEDLTQDEVDTLAVLAKTLKEKRKKKEDETVTIAVAARSKNNDEPVKIMKIPKKDSDILDTAPESDEIL